MKPDRALINKRVGAQLATRRWELNVNIGCVAESLHVEPRTVVRWESGAERTPAEALLHLAHLFGCPVSYFFETSLAPARSHRRSHLRVVGGKDREPSGEAGAGQVGNNMLRGLNLSGQASGLYRMS